MCLRTITSPAIYRWHADEGNHVQIRWVTPVAPFVSVYEVLLNDKPVGFVASDHSSGHERWTWATSLSGLVPAEDRRSPTRLGAIAALVEPLRAEES